MSLPALPVWNWTTLSLLLLLAVWQDLAHRRIPNPLLLCTASAALVLAAMPQGTGLVSALAAALVAGGAFLRVGRWHLGGHLPATVCRGRTGQGREREQRGEGRTQRVGGWPSATPAGASDRG